MPVGVCVTPTLPLADPGGFADRIARLNPAVAVVQDFHDAGGRFGADTGPEAVRLRDEFGWGAAEYRRFVEVLRRRTRVYEGEEGFFPPPAASPAAASTGDKLGLATPARPRL